DQKVLSVATWGDQALIALGGSGNAAVAFDRSGTRLWRFGCNGDVQAATATNGQWIIGGHFGTCAGIRLTKIGAIDLDGSIDTSWRPRLKGSNVHGVWALSASSTELVAGGD